MGELYRLDFANGRSYIGVTTVSAQARLAGHRKAARGALSIKRPKRNNRQTPLYRAWNKYGEPTLVLLAALENRDLYETEIKAIRTYRTRFPRGYNFTDGGERPPSIDPVVAAKIGRSLAGRIGDRRPKGPMSDDHKKKISIGLLNSAKDRKAPPPFSEAHRAKLSAAGKKRKISKEHLAKMVAARIASPKALEALIARNKRGPSAATRRKMSQSRFRVIRETGR